MPQAEGTLAVVERCLSLYHAAAELGDQLQGAMGTDRLDEFETLVVARQELVAAAGDLLAGLRGERAVLTDESAARLRDAIGAVLRQTEDLEALASEERGRVGGQVRRLAEAKSQATAYGQAGARDAAFLDKRR